MLQSHLPGILCCVARFESQCRIRDGLGSVVSLTFLADRSAVRPAILREDCALVLAEVVDAFGSRLSAQLIEAWHQVKPVRVIGVVRAVPEEIRLVADAIHAGIDDILIIGIDDVLECVGRALRARRARAAGTIHELLDDLVDARTVDLIEACASSAGQASPLALARSAGVSQRTLARRFARDGLPAPGTILRWVRVLLTLRELLTSRSSVREAARHNGYSSNSAFRSTLRQLLDMSPTEARAPEGYERARAVFAATLRRARADGPVRGLGATAPVAAPRAPRRHAVTAPPG